MTSASCNRAFFIGIGIDSLKANRRAWAAFMFCENQAHSQIESKIRERVLKQAIVALFSLSANLYSASSSTTCQSRTLLIYHYTDHPMGD